MDTTGPFAGYKMSGYGRESRVPHPEEDLNVKAVWIKTDCSTVRLPPCCREAGPH